MLLLFVFCLPGAALAAAGPTPLASVEQVAALSYEQASRALPVKLEATITYVRPSENNLFIMDGGSGVYVHFAQDIGLLPGDRVGITGVTGPSFRTTIVASQVRFHSHGTLPKAQPAKFDDLIQAKWDSVLVQIEGRVLAVALDEGAPYQSLHIRVRMAQGVVEGVVAHPGRIRPEDLLDANVRMTGVAAGAFDGKMQMAGVWLYMNSWQDVEILNHPAADPWTLPVTPMDLVVNHYRSSNDSERVRVRGTLTYFEPGTLAVVEEQGKSILLKTDSALPLHAGAGVEATGFPGITDGTVRLENAELRQVEQPEVVEPKTILWERASTGAYAYNLVAIEGEVVAVVHDARVDLFIIQAEGHLFSATLRHGSSDASTHPAISQSPAIGSRVRVTGVCFVDAGNHWRDRLWFDLRMRSLEDVVILQQPSWWTVKRLSYLITLLSAAILAGVIWVGFLDRRLRKQNAVLARQNEEDAIRERRLARQEQQRSHILELISSSRPLPEVLDEIRSMVSSRLLGAECWFKLNTNAGGAEEPEDVSKRPANPAVLTQEMFSPEGTSFGFLCAIPKFKASAKSEISAAISAALVTGARLAELAIDTRRLYSDLRHRSEHDLLTEIPNRFSMEKQFDRLMAEADRIGTRFGLIYVDLDRFKQINDRYGHRIGDMYLQEVTRRMKLQLRSQDVLARIGGDEFIALVPILRSRSDAEEIVLRLDRCFDEPFDLEGHRLRGSASVGLAVYPEDGDSKESLQRSADAAMYANKETKREQQKLNEVIERVWSGELLR